MLASARRAGRESDLMFCANTPGLKPGDNERGNAQTGIYSVLLKELELPFVPFGGSPTGTGKLPVPPLTTISRFQVEVVLEKTAKGVEVIGSDIKFDSVLFAEAAAAYAFDYCDLYLWAGGGWGGGGVSAQYQFCI